MKRADLEACAGGLSCYKDILQEYPGPFFIFDEFNKIQEETIRPIISEGTELFKKLQNLEGYPVTNNKPVPAGFLDLSPGHFWAESF